MPGPNIGDLVRRIINSIDWGVFKPRNSAASNKQRVRRNGREYGDDAIDAALDIIYSTHSGSDVSSAMLSALTRDVDDVINDYYTEAVLSLFGGFTRDECEAAIRSGDYAAIQKQTSDRCKTAFEVVMSQYEAEWWSGEYE
ncbi:MAG: hypothetical protein F4Y44_01960 [Chloroflexi bacterium]|nr:hypothetical protein [Chloroflexota bacterium]